MGKQKNIILELAVLCAVMFFFPALSSARIDESELNRIEKEMISGGKYQEALSFLEAIPEGEVSVRVLADKGLAYYGMRDYSEALDVFKEVKNKRPPSDLRDMIIYAIDRTAENKELLDGIELLENELDALPEGEARESIKDQLAASHFMIINELVSDKHYYPSMVVSHIRWLKDNTKGFEGLYLLSADILYSAMFYKEAAEDYKKALEEDSDNIRAARTLADSLVTMGDYSSAGKYYDRAIELYLEEGADAGSAEIASIQKIKQAFPRTHSEIEDLISRRQYYEAEKICRKRLSLKAGDATAMIQLGQIYWKTDRRKQAIKLFRKVIKMAPDHPFGYFYLGKAYVFERKPGKAIKNFDIFMEKMEDLPEKDEGLLGTYVAALSHISYMYSIYGTKEEAFRAASKGVEVNPADPFAHYNLAVIYYNEFYNRPKAYAELQKVIELDPESDLAERAEYYIEYMRRHPDARVINEFSIIYQD